MVRPLFLQIEQDDRESVGSYVLRSATMNRSSPRRIYAELGLRWHGAPAPDDLEALGAATVAGRGWLQWRTAWPSASQRWTCEWAGQVWRTRDLLHRRHCQVCPRCIHRSGFARLEWDLAMFGACPIHGCTLTTRCARCDRPLSWDRPAVDICRCRQYVSPVGDEAPADESVCGMLTWVSDSVLSGEPVPKPKWLDRLLPGKPTVDGVWRCVRAFGLRADVDDTAVRGGCLTPTGTSDVIQRGLRRLAEISSVGFDRRLIHSESLRLQCSRGVTTSDQALARHLLTRLGIDSAHPWRRHGVQFELFQ